MPPKIKQDKEVIKVKSSGTEEKCKVCNKSVEGGNKWVQ